MRSRRAIDREGPLRPTQPFAFMLGVLFCLLPAAASRAEFGSLGQVAGWEIDVDPDQELCSMTTDAGPDGEDTLTLVETPDESMSVIASSSAWQLDADRQMPVTLTVGPTYLLKSTGYTTDDGEGVVVVLGPDHRFLKALTDGVRLRLSTTHASVSFRLSGAQRALGAVAACIVNLKSDDGGEPPPSDSLSL
jgi:hypothetical protein